jgi:ribosomal-protein-alanine N-acetyltransferase
VDQAELEREYYLENRAHLKPWEPARDKSFYALDKARARLQLSGEAFEKGTACHFAILDNATGRMIGTCNFSNIVRGVFQACYLGYSIAASHEGKGLMYEALDAAIKYMFEKQGLHRIMANHLPENERSANLLKRLGFEREGLAKSYLKIAGKWRDHVLNSKVNIKDI